MSDIELVVKIDAERYESIKKHNGIPTVSDGVDASDAILYGIPLPKGHGELVDIRPLMRGLYEETCTGELTYTTSEVYKMLENEAPTILEADRSEV